MEHEELMSHLESFACHYRRCQICRDAFSACATNTFLPSFVPIQSKFLAFPISVPVFYDFLIRYRLSLQKVPTIVVVHGSMVFILVVPDETME